ASRASSRDGVSARRSSGSSFPPDPTNGASSKRLTTSRLSRLRGGLRYCVNMPLALSVSSVAGAVSGLVGVGGGILKVPMMVLLFGIPIEIAVASSAFMIGITALGGFAGHLACGHWDWKTSLLLGVAVFLGGQIGARKSVTLDKKKIKPIFGWFLVGVAVLMAVKALTYGA
ncbi:MAG: sulfite exporter TauE/SafE family protein, partial [Planctomycetota bacterium]